MPRFVILEHDHPVIHWDLMLEASDGLQTWRLAEVPTLGPAIDAQALGDHRITYLDYEGPVSGGRGTVRRWDVGDFDEEADSVPTARKFVVRGLRIAGRVLVERIEGSKWRFMWITAQT